VLNIPNFLTLLRIVAITDSLDGAIARITNTRTTLGAYMDPLADKMLILSGFVALALIDSVPRWLTVVVISRDVIILVGYLSLFLLTQQLMEIRPSVFSKAATFLHLATLAAVLLSLWRAAPAVRHLGALFGITGAITAISGFHYIFRGLRWYQQKGGGAAVPAAGV